MKQPYDVAAYIWPAYHNDKRAKIFWPKGIGEWEVVMDSKPKYEGHLQPRKPIWGYVNEADRYVMEMEINAAADHGVNTFIYDWYWFDNRPFLENCLNEGYLNARNNDRVQFFLMWANHNVNALWDKRLCDDILTSEVVWRAALNRQQFEEIADRILEKYMHHPSYYRIDGKPVFMIYDMKNLIEGLGGIHQTAQALDWWRERAVISGLPGLHLQCHLINLEMFREDQIHEITRSFDSISFYHMCNHVDIDRDYIDAMMDMEKVWYQFSDTYSIPTVPQISIGWDTNPRFNKFWPGVIKNATPDGFEEMLNRAKAFLDKHPDQPKLMTVNSWNEWTETGYLQPDELFGYGYLEAVRHAILGK